MAKKDSIQDILATYSADKEVESISTGILGLDKIFGGGLFQGSMYAFWGAQGSGKSSLCFQILRRFSLQGKKSVFIDVEKAFNKNQQKAFGLDKFVEDGTILHLSVDNYDQLLEVSRAIAETNEYSLIIIDSETQLLAKLPEDASVTDNQPGQKAKQASIALNVIKSLCYDKNMICIVLFHARANIQMVASRYAPQMKQAGGYAAKHIPDVILEISAGAKIKEGDQQVGQLIYMECEKNKFYPPFQRVARNFYYGKGVSKVSEIVDLAIEQGIIQAGGAGYYTMPDGTKYRGTSALYDSITKEQLKELQSQITI